LIKKKSFHHLSMGRALGVSVPRSLEGGFKPNGGEKKIDHQYQAVASNITPSMGKKPPLSWTWAQCARYYKTCIAIWIKGILKIHKNFKSMGDPWAQPAHKQEQSGHKYVNPTYVGQAH
jgi:hypothetical protein